MKLLKALIQKYKYIKLSIQHPGPVQSITYVKYPKQSTFENRLVLNVGCGNTTYPAPNVTNLDMYQRPGVNVTWDLSKTPLPFRTGQFDLVIANHILEHVPNWFECFKELARVVKVGGIVEVWLPGDGNSSQLGYRDHINVINMCSFVGVRGTWRNRANAWEEEEHKTKGDVANLVIEQALLLPNNFWWIHMWPQSIIHWMMLHLRNVCTEQGFIFRKLPPEIK
jgi:SAM-dependent methyltransferase